MSGLGDDVRARTTSDTANVECHAALDVLQRGDSDDLMRQLVNRARPSFWIESSVRRHAVHGQFELADAFAARLRSAAREGGLENVDGADLPGMRFDR